MNRTSCGDGGASISPPARPSSNINSNAASASLPLPLPDLPTLEHKPSWVNRAGRVDRSACAELRASDIWRYVPQENWRALTSTPSPSTNRNRPTSHNQPRERVGVREQSQDSHRRTNSYPEAHAHFTITGRFMAKLHDTRPPRQLAGDFRTRKSNAMHTNEIVEHVSFAPNPNRGATRRKLLGLWSGREPFYSVSPATREGWRQTVRIERWRLHEKLAQHFLICPRCRRKNLKLFLVLVRDEEMRDAQLAQGWLNMYQSLCASPLASGALKADRTLREFATRLCERYGLLFRGNGEEAAASGGAGGGRLFVCKKCLGIRYGEVKWKRQAVSDAQRRARYQAKRAEHEAQCAANDREEIARQLDLIAQTIPAHVLYEDMQRLQKLRLKRARRERENDRRRERRRAQRQNAARAT